uniref:Poly [ADP-ribose] polymerase 14 n=1 Tax=Malurus cyaneus samueli TaxID=2593467 RepID=A0A8C5TTH1_9PASS
LAEPCSFPLLVRGDWGPAEPPPALRKKLLCYFQSQKRSGGGECELRAGTEPGTEPGHILVCFSRPEVRQRVLRRPVHELEWGSGGRLSLQVTALPTDDAQEVLQRKHHLNKTDLVVKPWQVETFQESCQVENSEGSLLSSSVVLENVKDTTKDYMLIMLVENVSGLSEEDGDFIVEMIPELCAAVVTFTGNTGKEESELKQQHIIARCLEQTKSVRAENIPPNTPNDYITIYFENKKYGGAQVVDVQQLPDEDAAIITFTFWLDSSCCGLSSH